MRFLPRLALGGLAAFGLAYIAVVLAADAARMAFGWMLRRG